MNRKQTTLDVTALRRLHFEGALRASQSKRYEPVIIPARKEQASQPAATQSQTAKT